MTGLPRTQIEVINRLIGMISDEIEQLRAKGHDDAAIAALVSEVTGKPMTAELISQHHASPEERGHP